MEPDTSNAGRETRASAPATESSGTEAPPWKGADWFPLLVAAVAAVILLTLQTLPTDIDTNGDVSLAAVLNYAHEQHWQFGRDIVFTYGPLGFLTFFYYYPHASGARFVTAIIVCFTAAAGLSLIAWRVRLWWRWLLLATFLFAASNLEPRTDLVFNIGLFCWALLCFVENGRRLQISLAVLAVVAAFSSLAKASYVFPAGITVLVLAIDLALRRRARLGLAAVAGFAVAFLAGWCAAGQKPTGLWLFLTNTVAMVRAYNQALGWEGMPVTRNAGLALAAVAMVLVLIRAAKALGTTTGGREMCERPNWLMARRGLLTTWLLLITFVFWKHGFVRADFVHAGYFMGFVPVLLLGLEALPGRERTAGWWTSAVSALFCGVAMICLQWYYLPAFPGSLLQPVRAFGHNLLCLVNPAGYWQQMKVTMDSMRQAAQLPRFRKSTKNATIDFFGNNQVYLLFNRLNYRPAPVFQTYAVCDERLAQLNEAFYTSSAAPEFVVFTLGTVDRKFPPLDDSRVLRDLLVNYELTGTEGRFLLLRRKSTESPNLTLMREGSVRPGEPIDLTGSGTTNVWLEIALQPGWAGRLRRALYRVPVVRLGVWREPGKGLICRNRAPASNLAAGFLATPLLVKTKDVKDVYEDNPVTRPGAYTVELTKGEEGWWNPQISFRVYQIQNPLGRSQRPADSVSQPK